MMYKVIKFFTDLHDNNYPYSVGDIFPRPGISVTDARLAELAGSNNRQGEPLIARVDEPKAAQPSEKAPAKKTRKKAEK